MSLSKTFRVVLISSAIEPALDVEAMMQEVQLSGVKATRISAYVATRDERHLAIVEGREPSWYTLRPLSARETNSLVGDLRSPDPAELWSIVRRCLVAVSAEGLTLGDEDFRIIDAVRGTRELTESAMERVAEHVGLAGVRELGECLVRRASVPASATAPFAPLPG